MAEPTAARYEPVIPHLTVHDGASALEFYTRAFGAEELVRACMPGSTKILHASMKLNGGMIHVNDDFPEMSGGESNTPPARGGSPVTIHLTVAGDIDAAWARAVEAGATIEMPLDDQFWGSRYGTLRDPFGHSWSLGTPQEPIDGEEIERRMAAMAAP